nr:Gag-Pro-Pol protein [Nuttalliella namaqua]
MGSSLSVDQKLHAEELKKLLQQHSGEVVPVHDLTDLLREIDCQCPWYPYKGTLKAEHWRKIGTELQAEPRAPIQHLLLSRKVLEAVEAFFSGEPVLLKSEVVDATPPPYPVLLPAVTPTASGPPSIRALKENQGFRGVVMEGLHHAKKSGQILVDGEEWAGENPALFPVTRGPIDGQGNAQVDWEPLPYSVLRELNRAVKDSGLQSTFVQGILEGLNNGYLMTPHDWKALFRMILTPSQYVVWDSEYQQAARLGATAQITAEQVYGAGQFEPLAMQCQLPDGHIKAAGACVLRALRRVPSAGTPARSFAVIKQGPSEPYTSFVDRLKVAIARQLDNVEAQGELLQKLAFENANADSKKALQGVIHRQTYSLADMIQACAEIGSKSYDMSLLAMALKQSNKPTGNCYNCQKPGHFRAACRAPGGGAHKSGSNQKNAGRPSKKCPRCNKGYHWANQCRTNPVGTETSPGNRGAGLPRAPE